MDEIIIGVKDFLSQVAAPHGLQLESIERTFKQEIAGGKDFGITVGPESKHYTIPVADLVSYFVEKEKPKAVVPDDKSTFEDFMKDGPSVPEAPAPAEKPKNVRK